MRLKKNWLTTIIEAKKSVLFSLLAKVLEKLVMQNFSPNSHLWKSGTLIWLVSVQGLEKADVPAQPVWQRGGERRYSQPFPFLFFLGLQQVEWCLYTMRRAICFTHSPIQMLVSSRNTFWTHSEIMFNRYLHITAQSSQHIKLPSQAPRTEGCHRAQPWHLGTILALKWVGSDNTSVVKMFSCKSQTWRILSFSNCSKGLMHPSEKDRTAYLGTWPTFLKEYYLCNNWLILVYRRVKPLFLYWLNWSFFICEGTTPHLPLRICGSCPHSLNSTHPSIFGACTSCSGKGYRKASVELPICPLLWGRSPSQLMHCVPEINSSGPLHKPSYPLLIISNHILSESKCPWRLLAQPLILSMKKWNSWGHSPWSSDKPVAEKVAYFLGYSDSKPRTQLPHCIFLSSLDWHILFWWATGFPGPKEKPSCRHRSLQGFLGRTVNSYEQASCGTCPLDALTVTFYFCF